MPGFHHRGLVFRYEIIGAGSPIIFLHGLGGDLSDPRELLGPMASHRLIVWDCRSHGATKPDGKPDDLNFDTFAQDLGALMGHLSISRAVIGGISMGAGIAVNFAVRRPQAVRALVLVRPAWLLEPSPPNLRLITQIGRDLGEFGPAEGRRRLEQSVDFRRYTALSRNVATSLLQQFQKPRAKERRSRLIQLPLSVPLRDSASLRKVKAPVLVIGNRRDPLHPFAYAEKWARWLPNARLREIPSKSESVGRHQRAFRRHLARFLAKLD